MTIQVTREGLMSLCTAGWEPRKTPMRSSSYRTYRTCPFRFLLKERFGFQRPSRLCREALWLGTCAHLCWEALMKGKTGTDNELYVVAAVKREIQKIEDSLAASGQSPLSADEKADLFAKFEVAATWVNATWRMAPIDFEKFVPLLVEEKFDVRPKSSPFTSAIALKLDGLLHNKERNEIWIMDFKTTAYPTGTFLASRLYAVQPLLYRIAVALLLEGPVWRDTLGVGNAKFAGFIHYVIEKPSIRVLKKTLKNSGKQEARLEYLDRCEEWYRGVGEFKAAGEQRSESNRTVNIQFRRFRSKDPYTPAQYEQLRHYDLACQRPVALKHFPPHGESLLPMTPSKTATLSIYQPFYDHADDEGMKRWPDIADTHGFIRSFREDNEDEGISL